MGEFLTQASIDALVKATEDAREVMREVHGMTKDLRHLLAECRKIKQGAVDDFAREVIPLGLAALDGLDERIEKTLLGITNSIPLSMLCSGCGHLLAVMYEPGKECHCGACGHRFLIRTDIKSLARATKSGMMSE